MKPLALLISLVHLVLFTNITAQTEDKKLKEVFLDAEYFFLNEDYDEAITNYLAIYRRGFEENGNINYRIGQCYLRISDEKEKAIPYLEKAINFATDKYQEGVLRETGSPLESYYYLGNAYRINNQLDKAILSYEKYKTFYSKDIQRIAITDLEISACNFAKEQMKVPVALTAINLGRPVSTSSHDICPVVSGNQNSMAYIMKQKFYDAVYYSYKREQKWSSPVNITPDIQSDGDQYPTFFSYDGKELYLRKEDNFEADLMVSKLENGEWSKSKSVGKLINSKYWEGNMSITRDGNTMYFSSNRNNGMGAMDIYKSIKLPGGEWGEPVNLGAVINTNFNEDAPYITEDGTKLYFISQGHTSMGGYDIYYCNLLPDGQLSSPVHLGYPINTTDDDLFFYPINNGTLAYTALSQKGNYGYEDIFLLDLSGENKNLAAATENITTPPLSLENTESKNDTVAASIMDAEITKSTALHPVEPIIIPTLFFDFNSSELTENSKKSLDYISTVVKNYEYLKIQFIGHSDAIGSETYNQMLSEKRALTSKKYLQNKGIASEIISAKGLGEKKSIAVNYNKDGSDNPEGRKYNRRVEIQITDSKAEKSIIKEELNIPSDLKAE